ncbi:MAG: hypothetical protein KF855_11825 [Acidobacteria bacterium]|nr:hypothetical protein [Acidobacteriota bacterium]
MEETTPKLTEVPSAMPGFEDDDAREKLLLESASDELEDAEDDEISDIEESAAKPQKRRWQLVRTFAAFAVFICLMVVGLAWFFGMGWFSEPQTQAVNRTDQREAQANPMTEDEKLRVALSMVGTATASSPRNLSPHLGPDGDTQIGKDILIGAEPADLPVTPDIDTGKKTSNPGESYSLPPAAEYGSKGNTTPVKGPQTTEAEIEPRSISVSKGTGSDGARGRSLFFGISKKPAKEDENRQTAEPSKITEAVSPEPLRPAQIPFGTMLPVRLVGSIYTLRNSGGFVRMELTRPVEGKGYAYPTGTMIIGNVRSGESVRAFVTIVGLIDPDSGELVRFNGELLGKDGASGIEGKRRRLTSQWARFFSGLQETAASVLGSVGAIRSGSTVILSEPVRRGTESMTEDLSDAFLKNERENTFLEVSAGSNGYVLVTGLPENSFAARTQPLQEAAKE